MFVRAYELIILMLVSAMNDIPFLLLREKELGTMEILLVIALKKPFSNCR